MDEYELSETTTGLRPGSPDNGPIVGATDIPGLLVATGHYRNGILLAPITATEIVRLLTASAPDGPDRGDGRHFAPFRPQRFSPPTGPVALRNPTTADADR